MYAPLDMIVQNEGWVVIIDHKSPEDLSMYTEKTIFPFNFESNGNPFGSKSKGKLSPRSYPIQCERKWKYSFLSVSGDKTFDASNMFIDYGGFRIWIAAGTQVMH